MTDPFKVLGVSKDCTHADLRQAFRDQARKWHPDRFMQGPERDWANMHMTEINSAYQECLQLLGAVKATAVPVAVTLDDVGRLIARNAFSEARHALLKSADRCARWNYLFALVLEKQGEVSKALTYYNFAVRQAPENTEYRTARDAARRLCLKQRVSAFFGR